MSNSTNTSENLAETKNNKPSNAAPVSDEILIRGLTELISARLGGQAVDRQLNIAEQRRVASRNALTSANIGLVTQGIKLGGFATGGSII